jgi:hypothetical protein
MPLAVRSDCGLGDPGGDRSNGPHLHARQGKIQLDYVFHSVSADRRFAVKAVAPRYKPPGDVI